MSDRGGHFSPGSFVSGEARYRTLDNSAHARARFNRRSRSQRVESSNRVDYGRSISSSHPLVRSRLHFPKICRKTPRGLARGRPLNACLRVATGCNPRAKRSCRIAIATLSRKITRGSERSGFNLYCINIQRAAPRRDAMALL